MADNHTERQTKGELVMQDEKEIYPNLQEETGRWMMERKWMERN